MKPIGQLIAGLYKVVGAHYYMIFKYSLVVQCLGKDKCLYIYMHQVLFRKEKVIIQVVVLALIYRRKLSYAKNHLMGLQGVTCIYSLRHSFILLYNSSAID